MVDVVRTVRELRECCDGWRGRGARVGLVPTMGALHDGHISLVAQVRDAGATHVVLTIFVNPTQFAAGEDLDRYPRTLDADLTRCDAGGVDLVFAPDALAMYAPGHQTYVSVESMTQTLEGAIRPTHFRGVTTVVAKLFNMVGPCVAAFGRKDYQQWRVIETMARDLDMPVVVLGCPIVRETDGLALSSRNRYLSDTDRARALCISRGLRAASSAFAQGERSAAAIRAIAEREVSTGCDRIDYVTVVDATDLTPIDGRIERSVTLLIAAHVGATRLIDNVTLTLPLASPG
jgi:pantoate--beta-alanine ligase